MGAVDHSRGAASFEMTRLNREVRLDHPKEKVQGLQSHQGMTGELLFLITRRPREGHSVQRGRTVDLGIVAGHRVWPGMGLMGFCPRLTGVWGLFQSGSCIPEVGERASKMKTLHYLMVCLWSTSAPGILLCPETFYTIESLTGKYL